MLCQFLDALQLLSCAFSGGTHISKSEVVTKLSWIRVATKESGDRARAQAQQIKKCFATDSAPSGGDFQGIRVYRPMSFSGVSTQRERTCSRAAKHGSMSPPGYPLAWFHPCIARLRFTWQVDCSSCCCLSVFLPSQLIPWAECGAGKAEPIHPAQERWRQRAAGCVANSGTGLRHGRMRVH